MHRGGSGDDSRTVAPAGYAWLDGAVREEADIVTAGSRLARELRRAYDEQQLAAGLKAWPTPRIVSWDVWLNLLLDSTQASVSAPQRLHTQAGAILWERCIRDAADGRTLNPDGLVRQARQAWHRINDWCVGIDDLSRCASNEDERIFAVAARAYRQQLAARGWIDSALLAGFVIERLRQGELEAPRILVLAGFDSLTPAAREVVAALEERGCRVLKATPAAHRATPRIVACADGDAELRSAGAWAREQLSRDGRARVAIVYPGLEQDSARAERLVREGFAPGWQQAAGRHAAAVHVSYGKRLSAYPLIAIGLLWLQWAHRGLGSREVSMLLRTPLGRSRTDGCSRLELELRRMPDRTWSAANLAGALHDSDGGSDADAWLARVGAVAASQLNDAAPDSPAAWADRIDRLLEMSGWPGDRRLDSAEFQLVNRWRELLNEFSRIEPVRPRLRFAEALARLMQAAAEVVWQPEVAPGLVQLLGTLEAAGLEFDHVWIANLHALQWPPPAHPLPLVSRALQRQAGMPDATPADTLEFAQRTLERLVRSSPSVVLSWPRADRESELAASPLLAAYASGQSAGFRDPGWYAASLSTTGALHRVTEDPVPRVRADERIRGGAYTVQRQVTDPLSAFACGRLAVVELATMEPGLSPRISGSIVHQALHELLKSKPSSSDIGSWLAAGELEPRIAHAVDAALAPHEQHADGVLRRLLALERLRLRSLLKRFVEAELGRNPFTVDSVEKNVRWLVHEVGLNLRVDRIDRLQDGSLLVIDYKTGAVKTLLDRDGEPKDVQLIVYAAALDGDIGGLALVNVGGSGIRYSGIGGSTDWAPLGPELWEQRLAAWKARVGEAIALLAEGDVRVNVARSTDDSRPLNVLSRIEELKREL